MPDPASENQGRGARSPWAMPAAGWKAALLRAWKEAGQDNIGLVASGVAFCAILALVPMLGAVVLSYGLFASPETVVANIRALFEVMPADAARLIGEQLANVVSASEGKKGFGLLLALAIALYGAMKGAGAMVTALNIAYDEEDRRGFVRLNLLNLAIVVAAVVMAILATTAITALGHLESLFPSAPAALLLLGKLGSYLLLGAGAAAAAATLYRFGPNREAARWVWLTPGSALAAFGWLAVTLGFGIYVANFGSYDATYGSLGAAVVLLTWLNLSAYVLLLGAEVNCELERQTARDTTGGAPEPIGERGAYAADTVAGEPASAAGSPPPSAAVRRLRPEVRASGATLPALLAGVAITLVRRAPLRAAALLALAAAADRRRGGRSVSRDPRSAARS